MIKTKYFSSKPRSEELLWYTNIQCTG